MTVMFSVGVKYNLEADANSFFPLCYSELNFKLLRERGIYIGRRPFAPCPFKWNKTNTPEDSRDSYSTLQSQNQSALGIY